MPLTPDLVAMVMIIIMHMICSLHKAALSTLKVDIPTFIFYQILNENQLPPKSTSLRSVFTVILP